MEWIRLAAAIPPLLVMCGLWLYMTSVDRRLKKAEQELGLNDK